MDRLVCLELEDKMGASGVAYSVYCISFARQEANGVKG
jgi:hypothetical protein